MFKRIKENEKLQKIKELWKNPKTHDIMVLAFWLIFIFVVIIFVRGTSTTNVKEEKQYNSLENIKSYDFTYKTNDIIINGQTYDDAIIFYKDNRRYYYKNNLYLIDDIVTQSNDNLEILKINHKMLNNLISGITPNTSNYFKQYTVPLDRFINLYEIDTDIDLTKALPYNIIVTIYLKDNVINKVTIDLSNYLYLKTNIKTNYLLTINYYNVNNISDFRKNYDKLVEVIG